MKKKLTEAEHTASGAWMPRGLNDGWQQVIISY